MSPPEEELHDAAWGLLGVPTWVTVPVRRCDSCDGFQVQLPHGAELHQLVLRDIIRQPRRLAGCEVRFLRNGLDLGGAELAAWLGVAVETVSRWENDVRPVPVAVDRCLRLATVLRRGLHELEEAIPAELPVVPGAPEPRTYVRSASGRSWKPAA